VIPAAGFGTRFLPATKAIPKELLPVAGKPVIQYVVEEAAAAGITRIVLVLSHGKEAILEHFGRNAKLETTLKKSGKTEVLQSLQTLPRGVKIQVVYQEQMRGLGDAVLCTREAVGDEPFAVLMGDTILHSARSTISPTARLVEAHGICKTSVIAIEKVPLERVAHYGVIAGEPMRHGLWRVNDMVEKPAPAEAPSQMAVCSRYVLTSDIFDKLARTKRGKGGEIQLTDALRLQCAETPIHALEAHAKRYDIGNKDGFLAANIAFARLGL